MAKSYQNPIITFKPTAPSWYKNFCIKINLVANEYLPEKVLHILDASESSRRWRKDETERLRNREIKVAERSNSIKI